MLCANCDWPWGRKQLLCTWTGEPTKSGGLIPPNAWPEATVAHTVTREIKQKNIHREAEDLCNFFESAIVPFAKLFIDTDDFAMEVIGQWATVVYRDMFQMKICCKVLIKAYDYRSKLFLVCTHIFDPPPLHSSHHFLRSLTTLPVCPCSGRVGRWREDRAKRVA